MTHLNGTTLPYEDATAVLTEALRHELGRILFEQDQRPVLDDDEIDARIERLEQENLALKRRARRSDLAQVAQPIRSAAKGLGIDLPETLPNDLGRRAVDLIRELKDIEAQALDGEDARSVAGPIVNRFSSADVDDFVTGKPVLLSQAWERVLQLYPTKSMKGNIDAIGNVAIEFFGDVPVSTITKAKQEKFFAWMARLPKSHVLSLPQ